MDKQPVDVLAVLENEICALPTLAKMITSLGCECDATEAVTRMQSALDAVRELIEAAERLADHVAAMNDIAGICNPDLPDSDPLQSAWAALAHCKGEQP